MSADRKSPLAVGDVLAGQAKLVSRERLYAFSGGPFVTPGWPGRNTHTDDEAAAVGGRPGMFAAGTQFEGHLLQVFVDRFGSGWFQGGRIDVRFLDSVYRDDTVTAYASVTAVPGGDEGAYTFDVWCEKQDGTRVLAGSARLAAIDGAIS